MSVLISVHDSPDTIWLPKSPQDLLSLLPTCNVYKSGLGSHTVVQTAPHVVFKYGGEFEEEIMCARFARLNTTLPIPRIIHHPPFTHATRSPSFRQKRSSPVGAWYICMEQIPGVPLDKVIDTMTEEQLGDIASQLRTILAQLSSVKSSNTLGSVSGGPYRNEFFPSHVGPKHSFSSVEEFLNQFREMLMLFCTEQYTENLLSGIPRNAAIKFTHGDLIPKNIIVEGSNITGIVDWATGGFYPDYWEYCRMHDPHFMTPGWRRVLEIVFPGKPRETEINTVCTLLNVVENTLG